MATENEPKVEKHCPFLNDICIGEKCAMSSQLLRMVNGVPKPFGACAFNSMVLMLSELNAKAQMAQEQKQGLQLPKDLLRTR